jgi:hypothetical protein
LALVFGAEFDLAIQRMTNLLASPDTDTGWRHDDKCEGDATRRVKWGDLELVFTRGAKDASGSSMTFQQWSVSAPGRQPAGMVTLEQIGIGSSVADLKRMYPSLKLAQPVPGDPAGLFTTKSDGVELIEGRTSNTSDRGVVTQMSAGFACQRVL